MKPNKETLFASILQLKQTKLKSHIIIRRLSLLKVKDEATRCTGYDFVHLERHLRSDNYSKWAKIFLLILYAYYTQLY